MITRDLKRLALVVGPLLVFLLLSASFWNSNTESLRSHVSGLLEQNRHPSLSDLQSTPRPPSLDNQTHTEIVSLSTADQKYFEVRFGEYVFNPNIIPDPVRDDTWFVVGQRWTDPKHRQQHEAAVSEQVGCAAQFINGVLMCIDQAARVLPYAPTTGDKCEGPISYFNMNVGPRDARVFYGPQKPYTTFGSNSGFTCFGQWIQDFRKLVNWEYELLTNMDFETGTELYRPAPFSAIEKNWFVFWDKDDQMHAHHDMFPNRAFAKLDSDGSVGPDLAPAVAAQDERCMARYLPKLPTDLESIHQATNSLKITMCNRSDALCTPDDSNTFIMSIIQHKTYYDWHSEYEPYVILFHQRAPYELYAISKNPIWIHGRRRHSDQRTEMFYITSINWKARGVKYHGYLDDDLFVAFGIEDKHSGAIDVRAAALLVDLGFCNEP